MATQHHTVLPDQRLDRWDWLSLAFFLSPVALAVLL